MVATGLLKVTLLLVALTCQEVHSLDLQRLHGKKAVKDDWEEHDMIGSSLRGALVGKEEDDTDDDDDDDDDDKDDDDDDKAVVSKPVVSKPAVSKPKVKSAPAVNKVLAASSSVHKSAPSAEDRKKMAKLGELHLEKVEAEAELKKLNDNKAFEQQLELTEALVTNQTQSTALADVLVDLKRDIRKYALPEYAAHLQKQIDEADTETKKLEGAKPSEPKKEAEGAKAPEGLKAPEKKVETKEAVPAVPDGVDDVKRAAGQTFATAFFANVALFTAVFAMGSAENKVVRNYTWFIMDQVVAIFLAVLNFQAFDSMLDFANYGVKNEVFASIMHCIVMFIVVLTLAYAFRKSTLAIAVVCGAGAHFTSFSAIHGAASLQNKIFIGYSYSTEMAILGLFTLFVGLAIISFLTYSAKARARLTEDDDYMDKTDDLENDVGATAFSVVFTMLIRFALTGHHPVDDETKMDHDSEQRLAMFIYACVCLVAAAALTAVVERKAAQSKSYLTKRLLMFTTTVLAMNVAWAFLYWGEWEFFEAMYPGDEIRGRVLFAVAASVATGVGLILLSKAGEGSPRTKKVALTALALVCAFSWELCFDAAVEAMVDGQAHPVTYKVTSCLILEILIIPVYAYYMKPVSMPAAEAIGA